MEYLASLGNWGRHLDWGDPKVITVAVVMVLATLAVLALKGIALWRAALKNDKVWFVALLVVNTMGILEIAYIYYFNKRKSAK